jgi:cytochrome c556
MGKVLRMKKRLAICAVFSLATIGFARADGLDVIAVRQAGYALQGGNFAYIRAVVAAKGDVKGLEVPAKAIAKWGEVIPSLFPPGSDKGHDTKALPEIWTDKAGFDKISVALVAAATKLADSAKAGDAEAVAAETKPIAPSKRQAAGSGH